MIEVGLGLPEIVASGVGLVTGLIYTSLRAPIPAPNVLGGILAIVGTFVGYLFVAALRGQLTFIS